MLVVELPPPVEPPEGPSGRGSSDLSENQGAVDGGRNNCRARALGYYFCFFITINIIYYFCFLLLLILFLFR